MPALPIEGYDTTREDGVTRIRPVYAAPLPVEAVSVQGQGLLPQEPPALPVELPVERSGGILADADRALSGAVRAPFDALDERLFGKSGKKGTYREAIQKFFKTGPSDEVKTGVNRLLGTGGEERYKTWPEKLVVDAITGAGDYMGTDPTKTMGMRREDFTDAPPPQAKDGAWFNPVQAEPIDNAVKTAMDVSNLAGTGGLAGAGSGGVALGSGPLKQSKLALNDLAIQAKDYFGITKDVREAGYVLSDGTMLDLTGRHYSGDYIKTPEGLWKTPIGKKDYLVGKRNVDHRELDFYDKGGTDGMREFMNTAQAIRNQPGVGFDTTVVPTNAQLKTIVSNHNKTYRGEPLQVEISNPLTGKNLATKDFAKPNVESVNTWIQQEIKKHPTLFSDNQPSVGIGAVTKSEKPFYSAPVKRALSLPERLAAPTAHSFDATPPKFYKTEAVQKTSADGSKVKVSRNLIDGNFVDASGNIYTEVGKRIQKLSGDELAAYKKRYSERIDDIRNGVHAQNTKFDDQIDDLAKQLHDKGYNIQVSRPDDTSSRYLTVTKDGVSKKIRIADHAQPQEFVTNPTTGKSELQTVGGWSREKRERYSAADHSIDPSTGLTQEKVVALFSDNQPSLGIGAVSKSEKPFYSALEKSLGSINQAKATGEQWLGMLANKGGVKPDELQWSGIGEFLAGKPSVTKAEIDSFLKENAFGVQEVVKGGRSKIDQAFALAKEHGWKRWEDIDASTQAKYLQRVSREAGDIPTKYHDYQLPGGENYREVLMTLPAKTTATNPKVVKSNNPDYPYQVEFTVNGEQRKQVFKTEREANSHADYVKSADTSKEGYRSSHWDEPNILAHMRMNDRTIDGKKSLHLEEIQSDWHQAGRKQGYRSANDPTPKIQEIDKKLSEMRNKEGVTDPFKLYGVNKEYTKLADERAELYKSINNGVPDAPFKKNWHELALKRAIREAAENGYERLSWTPGEAQAARYDLSKQLKELQYLKHDDGKYELAGITVKGDGFNHPEKITADKLPDIVGKEIAEKIIKNEGKRARGHPSNGGYFEGLDLKIGGEGMKGFYDNIVPKTIEKLGKQYGVKVQTGKSGKDTIYYIDIPPAMRDKVLAEGFPLFSANVPVIDNDQAR